MATCHLFHSYVLVGSTDQRLTLWAKYASRHLPLAIFHELTMNPLLYFTENVWKSQRR